MSSKFRVGIIGVGGIAQDVHIPGWLNLPDVEIVAVADVHKESADRTARKQGIQYCFADYHELVKRDLDAVDICAPNRVHTPAALAALAAGKHVLCEKPLAVSTAEIRQMGQLADEKQLLLMTAQHQRFTGSARAIKNWAN